MNGWKDEDESETSSTTAQQFSADQLRNSRKRWQPSRFHALAKSIIKNQREKFLLTALRRGFAAAEKAQKNKGVPAISKSSHFHGIQAHPGVPVSDS